MATFLFVVISLIFIGLGLPDSLFGSAWPAIYSDLNLPISYANFVTTLISVGTVLSSFFAGKLVALFGTGRVAFLSTLLTTIMLVVFSFSNNIILFCIISVPLGVGAGAVDAALNSYVANNYSSMHMSLVHCFYGVGVSISPLLMSFALSKTNLWQSGYHLVAIIMAIITLFAFIALPLWNKLKKQNNAGEEYQEKSLSILELAKMPAVRIAWVVFFFTVALEFTCGIWATTYLVQTQGLSESSAAGFLTFYYLGITIGRLVNGFVTKWINPQKVVFLGYGIVGIAIILLFVPLSPVFKGLSLFLIGFGNGPTFPNLTYLTPRKFGREISASVIATQTGCCNLGILLMPPVFGFIAQAVGVQIFPICLLVIYVIMVGATIVYALKTANGKALYQK